MKSMRMCVVSLLLCIIASTATYADTLPEYRGCHSLESVSVEAIEAAEVDYMRVEMLQTKVVVRPGSMRHLTEEHGHHDHPVKPTADSEAKSVPSSVAWSPAIQAARTDFSASQPEPAPKLPSFSQSQESESEQIKLSTRHSVWSARTAVEWRAAVIALLLAVCTFAIALVARSPKSETPPKPQAVDGLVASSSKQGLGFSTKASAICASLEEVPETSQALWDIGKDNGDQHAQLRGWNCSREPCPEPSPEQLSVSRFMTSVYTRRTLPTLSAGAAQQHEPVLVIPSGCFAEGASSAFDVLNGSGVPVFHVALRRNTGAPDVEKTLEISRVPARGEAFACTKGGVNGPWSMYAGCQTNSTLPAGSECKATLVAADGFPGEFRLVDDRSSEDVACLATLVLDDRLQLTTASGDVVVRGSWQETDAAEELGGKFLEILVAPFTDPTLALCCMLAPMLLDQFEKAGCQCDGVEVDGSCLAVDDANTSVKPGLKLDALASAAADQVIAASAGSLWGVNARSSRFGYAEGNEGSCRRSSDLIRGDSPLTCDGAATGITSC